MITTPVSTIWGYSDKGVLYIQYNGEFNRVPIIGAICHFVANKTIIHESAVVNDRLISSYYGRYPSRQYTTQEMTQYILNFATGEVREYDEESIAVMLMSDPQLYDQYMELSLRKRSKKMFYYIRLYNERHPLNLPN